MNLQREFIPSSQLRERRSEAAKLIDEKPAAKAVDLSELTEDELKYVRQLSEEELELAAVDRAGLAVLKLNGEVARIGLRWLPGMKEKWDAR